MSNDDATFETPPDSDDAQNHSTSGGLSTSASANPFSDHEPTQEEIDQLNREREERLDPENRWENAEVDNTQREWVSEEEDFRDNLEGNPPEWDKGDGAGTTRDPEVWQHLEEQTGKPVGD